mgnify:CR=1 FL=1
MLTKLDVLVAIRLAIRARFASFMLWLVLALATAVLLAANFSGRHPATLGLDLGLSLIRIALPLLTVLLLQELVCREFDRKLYLTSLTYPRTRFHFLASRIAAIALLLLGALAVLALLLAGLTHWISQGYVQSSPPALGWPYVVTIAFIALDLFVLLAIGTLLGITASTPSFVLIGTLGFMVVARSYSAIVSLLENDPDLVKHADTYQSSLHALGYFLPDLAALDVRMIALYGKWQFLPDDWAIRAAAVLAYAAALFGLATWVLNKKKFA